MNLHTKLVLALLSVLIVVIIAGQIVQMKNIEGHIEDFSKANIEILKQREERFVKNIHRSVERAVAGSLERGEMIKFTRILEEQKNIDGLLEFSLYDREWNVTHSTDIAFVGNHMLDKYVKAISGNKGISIVWEKDAIHVFKQQIVNADCIRCHKNWKTGESGGVTSLRFSRDALTDAESQAAKTIEKLGNSTFYISLLSVSIVILILALVISFLVKRMVSVPLNHTAKMLQDIAEGEGDLTKRLKVEANDEVGILAKWFNTFIEKLQSMISLIRADVDTLSEASSDLAGISDGMSGSVEDMALNLNKAAVSTKEVNDRISRVVEAIKETSSSVKTIASSTEEMTGTVKEIAKNTERAHKISNEAVQYAEDSSKRVHELEEASQNIGKITETIAKISDQTNLLALNATIEAARAGEAGRGFAVVANEVKELAKQTAAATSEIKASIDSIQASTGLTIDEIGNVLKVINDVNEIVTIVAAAAEEQSITTKDIARSISQVARGVDEVSQNVENSADVLSGVTRVINTVDKSAAEIFDKSTKLQDNANILNEMALNMKYIYGRFYI